MLWHRLRERVVASLNRGGGARVPLHMCPRLGLTDEPAQFLEQHLGGSVVPLELLDPLEPVDDGAGFVHEAKVPRQVARVRAETVSAL